MPFRPGELAIVLGDISLHELSTGILSFALMYSRKLSCLMVLQLLKYCKTVIYNDKVHDEIANKEVRDDRTIILEHGKPMILARTVTRV